MFKITSKSKETRARTAILSTMHGTIQTPAYIIVGTHAQVRCLQPKDLEQTNTQIIIANTYHLWRTIGDEGLRSYPGLHAVMGWDRPTITDSGGFQVFSLGFAREHGVGKIGTLPSRTTRENLIRITDDGVYFRDGNEELYLDAERSIAIQQSLGADIIIAFDECTSPLHDYHYTRESLKRTHRWAERSLAARTSSQAMFGVIQGGAFEDLRRESSRFIGNLPFDGFGIGGTFSNSFGSNSADTFHELDWIIPELPEQKARHLLGIGRIEDVFEGIERGIDLFDCVIPTREARHGALWTHTGRLDITKGTYQEDHEVIDPLCHCLVCEDGGVDRGTLREYFKRKDPLSGYWATIHNVTFFNTLMQEIRASIQAGSFLALKQEYLQRLRFRSR